MPSFCELCGRQITDEKKAVLVEGAIFDVCLQCSKHGKQYTSPTASGPKKKVTSTQRPKSTSNAAVKIRLTDDTILSPKFAKLIREARIKKGLTHEQLGMQMNEKANLLKKFETSALKPDEILAKKLERFLGIKLYVSIEEEEEG